MPKSTVNAKYEYSEDIWVVSVLNTDGVTAGLTGGGHVMITVEGIERVSTSIHPILYFRQCDILAMTTDEEKKEDKSYINTKGRITSVRCFSTQKADYDYSKPLSKSYYVDPLKAKAMIASILADKDICDRAAQGDVDVEGNRVEYPLYQRVGTNHFLSETGMGENCASWAIRHLAVAGIDKTSTMSKPKKVAGAGCVIS